MYIYKWTILDGPSPGHHLDGDPKRIGWARFLQSLKLDQRLEFEEGDVGIAGALNRGSRSQFRFKKQGISSWLGAVWVAKGGLLGPKRWIRCVEEVL